MEPKVYKLISRHHIVKAINRYDWLGAARVQVHLMCGQSHQ